MLCYSTKLAVKLAYLSVVEDLLLLVADHSSIADRLWWRYALQELRCLEQIVSLYRANNVVRFLGINL
jgi:hypothetical protein